MKTIDYAFIVHSRDRCDLPKRFPWLKILPDSLIDGLTMHLPPFVISKISGLVSAVGKEITGIIVGIPMTARQLLEYRTKGLNKIIRAVELAKSRGVKFIGLGAMTTSLSRGGRDVIDNIDGVYITTGKTYTVINITEYVDYCLHTFGLQKNLIKIGIVGAAGGIGSGTAISLARNGFKNFLLIDLERKLIRLKHHIKVLEKHAENLRIDISHKIASISSCDIVIAATNAPEVVIRSCDVSSGTIIINDAQPSDVSPEILDTRNDVLIIEGGVLHTPNINCHFDFGLAHRNDIFSCLAETLWLTYRDIKQHHSLGNFESELYYKMQQDGLRLGFHISNPQNDRGYVSEDFLEKFAKIIKARMSSKQWTTSQ